MRIEVRKKPLDKLYQRRDKIDLNPWYQRGRVWSKRRQQLLLDSVLKGMDIPKLYFRILDDGSYECIDGQQRLRAIFNFYENDLPLLDESEGLSGKFYKDLDEKHQDLFDDYEFDVVEIEEGTDAEISEMFQRLQMGVSLNAAEKLNAIGGNMRDFVNELAKHPFFSKTIVKSSRGAHELICAQITAWEILAPRNVKFKDLEQFYKNHRTFNIRGAEANWIRKVFNALDVAFQIKTPEIRNRASVVSLFLLMSQIMKEYATSGKEQTVRDFFVDFQTKLSAEVARGPQAKDMELIDYQTAVIQAADTKESIEKRKKILMTRFLLFVPNLPLLDSRRAFTKEQRVAIYCKNNGICQMCGIKVEWENFHADHIVPHICGGKTTVENGQTLCTRCNLSKGF
jgi:hypothetical protein